MEHHHQLIDWKKPACLAYQINYLWICCPSIPSILFNLSSNDFMVKTAGPSVSSLNQWVEIAK